MKQSLNEFKEFIVRDALKARKIIMSKKAESLQDKGNKLYIIK